jgi:hypothetical protein
MMRAPLRLVTLGAGVALSLSALPVLAVPQEAGQAHTAAPQDLSGVQSSVESASSALPAAESDVAASGGVAYHVDCRLKANGTGSADSPINSLQTVGALDLQPGDEVLFNRGTVCDGALRFKGSGTEDRPIIAGAYGTGDLPVINGGGIPETVRLDNQQYWEIRDLEITNTDSSDAMKYTAQRRGVVIANTDAGELTHFRLEGLYIHDVTGTYAKDLGGSGGIQLEVYTNTDASKRVHSWFNDTVIAGNTIESVNRSGINMSSVWKCRAEMGWDGCTVPASGQASAYPWVPSTGLVIRDNRVSDVGGDGIVVQMNRGALVEGNVVTNVANKLGNRNNAGIWPWDADDTVFQYNEVSHVQRLSDNTDGTAFDVDYGTRGTIFQYNYSHDNVGGMFLYCGCGAWLGTGGGFASDAIYRYNISENDGQRVGALFGATDSQFYNNTLIVNKATSQTLMVQNGNNSSLFANNLVITDGDLYDNSQTGSNVATWRGNVFSGPSSTWPSGEDNTVLPDALSLALGLGTDRFKIEDAAVKASGVPVAPEGTTDFFGNAVPSYCDPDVGVYQSSAFDDEDCSTLSGLALAGEASRTVDSIPAGQTLRVEATTAGGSTLSVANGLGLVQQARGTGQGTVAAIVRTNQEGTGLTLTCSTGDGCSDISIRSVQDTAVDGSFESIPTSGNAASVWSVAGAGRSTTTGIASGTRSLQLNASTTGSASTETSIVVEPGHTYELGGWVTASATTAPVTVSATVAGLSTAPSAASQGAGSPEYVSTRFTVPEGVSTISLTCSQGASDAAGYCDDITLVEVTPTPLTVVLQPADASVQAGDAVHLHAQFSSSYPTTIQWERFDGTTWVPVTSTKLGVTVKERSEWLEIPGLTTARSGEQYRAVATDMTGAAVTTRVTTVSVTEPPSETTEIGTLTGLSVDTSPASTQYLIDEKPDFTGLTLDATYSSGKVLVVRDLADMTIDASRYDGHHLGSYPISVSYTESGVTRSTSFSLTVVASRDATLACSSIAGVTVDATYTEGSNRAANTCDGSGSTKWSNWVSTGRTTDALTYSFASPIPLRGAVITWAEKTPGTLKIEYQDAAGNWQPTTAAGVTVPLITASTASDIGFDRVVTKGLRITMTMASGTNPYTKVAEIAFKTNVSKDASSDATLEDLAAGGTTVGGFTPSTVNYAVQIPSFDDIPAVRATPSDRSATVAVTQASADDPVARATVTAADGKATTTYTVTFSTPPILQSLTVLTPPTKTQYVVGDSLDLAGLTLTAAYDYGRSETIRDLSAVTIDDSSFDADTPGTYPITVSFEKGGAAHSASFDVTVATAVTERIACAAVTGVTASATSSQDEWGSFPASLSCDGETSTSWSDWKSAPALTTNTLAFTFPSAKAVGFLGLVFTESVPKGVTVEYLDADGQWQPFGVAQTPLATDAETAVTAETPVTTTSLRAVLDYGTGGYSKVTETSFGIVREAAKSADSTLSGLGVDGTPVAGFDPSTLDYTAYLDDMGTLPTVAATASNSKTTVAITQATAADPVARVTVTAEDGSTSQYTVAFALNELKSLTVAGDFRRDYAIGDVFDPTNLRVEGAFSDGSTRDVTAQATFSTDAFDRAGDVTVRVAVGGISTEVTVHVTATLTGIVLTPPTRTTYGLGDTVDLSGMRVVATYDDNTEVDVTDDVALSLPDTSRHGTSTGTVTYGGASATFTVEVTADPTSLTVQAPSKIVYTVGDPFDATGLRVLATYADGTTDDVTSQARVETPDLSTPGERTVTVLFGGLTAQFTVVVSADGTGSGTHPSTPSSTDTTSSAPAPAPALKLSDTGSTSAMTLAGGLFLAAAGWSAIRRRRRS